METLVLKLDTTRSHILENSKGWIQKLVAKPSYIQCVEILVLIVVFTYILDQCAVAPKRIKNVANVPSCWPFIGSLTLLAPPASTYSRSPCVLFENLSSSYGDVYQVRLGNRQVIVANGYNSILHLWIHGATKGNNSRPKGHTFHNLLSQSGVFTVGTTPFGPAYVRERKFVYGYLFNDFSQKTDISTIIDNASNTIIEDFYLRHLPCGSSNALEVDITRHIQYFHLKLALLLTYGYKINLDLKDTKNNEIELADEIIYVENMITRMRSHVSNIEDYLVQPLRGIVSLLNQKDKIALDLFKRRNSYLKKFYSFTKKSIETNELTEEIIKSLMYGYFTVAKKTLQIDEIGSICLTMVSAGLDNTSLNFAYLMGQLSLSPRVRIQAYNSLLSCYDHNRQKADNQCSYEMSCEYIVAVVKEALRLFTVLPMSLPRETTKDINYLNEVVIPPGTMLFMNSWAGNHDPRRFDKPYEFIPERFLNENNNVNNEIKHLSFGIGSRMCLGNNLAFKELYVLTCKYLLRFNIEKPSDTDMVMEANPLKLNAHPNSLAIEPMEFHVKLSLRDDVHQEAQTVFAL